MVGGLLVAASGLFTLGLGDYVPVPYVDYVAIQITSNSEPSEKLLLPPLTFIFLQL